MRRYEQTLRIWSWFPPFFTSLPIPRSIVLHIKPERMNETQVYDDLEPATTDEGGFLGDEMT